MDDAEKSQNFYLNEFQVFLTNWIHSNLFIFLIIVVAVFISIQNIQQSIKSFTILIFITLLLILLMQFFTLQKRNLSNNKVQNVLSYLDPWFENLEQSIKNKNRR